MSNGSQSFQSPFSGCTLFNIAEVAVFNLFHKGFALLDAILLGHFVETVDTLDCQPGIGGIGDVFSCFFLLYGGVN